MKIGEEFIDGGGDTFHVKRTYDYTPTLEDAKALASKGAQNGENWLIARIPRSLLAAYLKEHGVKFGDPAAEDLLARFINERDYSQFRVTEGKF